MDLLCTCNFCMAVFFHSNEYSINSGCVAYCYGRDGWLMSPYISIVTDFSSDFNHFSFAHLLQIFNDKLLKVHVRRCVGTAIRLRKKYFYKVSNCVIFLLWKYEREVKCKFNPFLCFAVNPQTFCFFLLLSLMTAQRHCHIGNSNTVMTDLR